MHRGTQGSAAPARHFGGLIAALALLSTPACGLASTTATYQYDAIGRVIQATYSDGTTVNYYYDSTGNRTQVTVNGALAIMTMSLPIPLINQSYSQTLTTSGGTAPITFTTTVGALPTGLTLGSAGGITGTPTASGGYNFTIKATDAHAATATRNFFGTIAGSLTITTGSLPAPTVNQSYSQTVATSGGTAPLTFSVSTGALPTGLSLNAVSGLISGTPPNLGAYSFTIQARDTNAVTATHSYSGTVAGGVADGTVLYVSSTAGAYSFTVPAGSPGFVDIEIWGSGGDGYNSNYNYGGGGGGGYSKIHMAVTPGTTAIAGSIGGRVAIGQSGETTVTSPAMTAYHGTSGGVGGSSTGGTTNVSGHNGAEWGPGGGAGNGGGDTMNCSGDGNGDGYYPGTTPGGGACGGDYYVDDSGVNYYNYPGANGQVKITARTN